MPFDTVENWIITKNMTDKTLCEAGNKAELDKSQSTTGRVDKKSRLKPYD